MKKKNISILLECILVYYFIQKNVVTKNQFKLFTSMVFKTDFIQSEYFSHYYIEDLKSGFKIIVKKLNYCDKLTNY